VVGVNDGFIGRSSVSDGAAIDCHVRQAGDVEWNLRDEDAMHAMLSEIIQCLK
jgi:hypothetical protein